MRAVAVLAAALAMLGLLGACSAGDTSPSAFRRTQDQLAATRARLARQRAQALRQSRARHRSGAAAKAGHPVRRLYLTPTTRPAVRARLASVTSTDVAAIRAAVDRLDAAFRTSVAAGVKRSETANYWVGAGVYTAGQCNAFETARGGGIVAETITVHLETLTPSPGWVDPVIGRVPAGRIYRMRIDELQTVVTTGERRFRSLTVHVTVRPNHRARLFLRCA